MGIGRQSSAGHTQKKAKPPPVIRQHSRSPSVLPPSGPLTSERPLALELGKEHLLCRNVQRFRGGFVFEADGRLCHSTLGLSLVKKQKKNPKAQPPPVIRQHSRSPSVLPKERIFIELTTSDRKSVASIEGSK